MQKAKIAKLEKGYRKEEINKAKANLLQNEVQKNKLKKDYERALNLYKRKSLSEQEYDNIKSTYEVSKANYLYAKSSLEMLENGYEKEDLLGAKAQLQDLLAQKKLKKISLEDTILRSPTNGTVITRVYETGSIVNASQSIMQIAKDDEFWVRSYMSEKYLGTINVGQEATIYTDNGSTYKGVVSFISPLAEFTPKSVQTEELRTDLVYRYRIVLKDFDDKIRQGMPVSITFKNINFGK